MFCQVCFEPSDVRDIEALWRDLWDGCELHDGLFASGARISRIILFSPETAPHEDTPLQLGPTPHPTPWGGSPTPRRMLAVPPDGWGGTNGRIGPRGWVAKMRVLQEISGEMGQTPETSENPYVKNI